MEKDYLLRKWLSNELTAEELAEFKKTDDYDLNVRILEGARHFEASQFSEVKPFDDLKNKLEGRNRTLKKFNSYRVLFRIAAVLVIALGVYFGFFANRATTVKTLASQKTTFELPDASTVTLNADSKLAFNKKYWSGNREVHLEGEAFFKV
ncbi:MAG: FecR domain-containing protein, partial [Flavobacteriaceae bacterium]|nr:FecR domain-containing protein [Flavobacteriaceae bacterium]